MEMLFPIDKPASGHKLIGREREIQSVMDTLTTSRRGILLCAPAKQGKNSIVREALRRLRLSGTPFQLCEINSFNIRTRKAFTDCFKRRMIECFKQLARNSLLTFGLDPESFPDERVFELPALISREAGIPVVVYLREFQNLLSIEDPRFHPEEILKEWTNQPGVRFILTGSAVNAMRTALGRHPALDALVERVELRPIAQETVAAYIVESFLTVGRVVAREEALEICRITGCNMWYVNLMCSICYALPVGYVNRNVVSQAREALLEICAPQFFRIMSELTESQIRFLQAVCDGERRLSGAEALARYRLNSSAHVFRLKDSFRSKELLSFDPNDAPRILDPVFEYWLKNVYFK